MIRKIETDSPAFGHLTAVITILIWGTTFISTKVLLTSFTPIEILFCRFIIGFIALNIFYPKRMKIKDRKHELLFAFAGLCGITLYFLFENIALTYTLASNVGVIVAISPFFSGIISALFNKGDKPKLNFYLGFFAAICGIAIISFNDGQGYSFNPMGDILAILAAFIWAVYSFITKKIGSYGYNTIQTTRRCFGYGLIFMVPALFFLDFNITLDKFSSPQIIANFLYLGLLASAACFAIWGKTINILGDVKTSVYIYLVPVVTVITSVIVLGEKITFQAALGIILTISGLVLSELKFSRLCPVKISNK